ncbi:shikimate dehydrogenase [Flavobacterium amniphilum]|uniref:shikimate dehydrogenase family protein n=1 Tax=Flavobacterium amniphilum TaxID=1834035 RepID=UPI00202A4D5F|nr:shikimate dehydrogenase [Flavobacterium amniphilum]MCL9805651.1 shikimate dehydrogenase [Flavobacterium amniphilum]
MRPNKKLGLLGRNISYSFSRNYFAQKFEKEGLTNDYTYVNFDIPSIAEFKSVIKNNPDTIGMNVTIPYKEEVIPFLDQLSENAKAIGAVNTIKVLTDGKLEGHNTDYFGFTESLKPLLKSHHKKALILGTGGAAKAIAFGLQLLGIEYQYVSRKASEKTIPYENIDQQIFSKHTLIINCTPLGTSPNIEACPDIPYEFFTEGHIAYDLIYNPEETEFLKRAKQKKAVTKNGYEMLVLQAEKAWKIWTD